jgi:uncharacterized membrane protein YeaQ/YmgE (transglycosylase-associated protein family)
VEGVIVEIIGVLVAGLIIGLLGKFVAPGDRDNIPLWLTLLCGIGGVLIGYYVAAALGVEATSGIDWIRWIISIIVAAVLVIIAATVTGRRTSRRVGKAVHHPSRTGSARPGGDGVGRFLDGTFPPSPGS